MASRASNVSRSPPLHVKRWRNAAMALRWTAAGLMEAVKSFRRLKARKQLPILKARWLRIRPSTRPTTNLRRTRKPHSIITPQRSSRRIQMNHARLKQRIRKPNFVLAARPRRCRAPLHPSDHSRSVRRLPWRAQARTHQDARERKASGPTAGDGWLHEIKHDGFRCIARKDGKRVRLYSRPGNDLTWRFIRIVEAVARLKARTCIIDCGSRVRCA